MKKHELDALITAASVITKLDGFLTAIGCGRNMSGVPGYQGADFVDQLKGIIGRELNKGDAPIALPVRHSEPLEAGFVLPYRIVEANGEVPIIGANTQYMADWLVNLINGTWRWDEHPAVTLLRDFTRTITSTGGIMAAEDGRPLQPVNDSEDWIDLADCYERACQILGETPLVEPSDPTYSKAGSVGNVIYSIEGDGNDLTWTCVGGCKRTFSGPDSTTHGTPHSEGCGSAVCYSCLDLHRGICPECKEPFETFMPASSRFVFVDAVSGDIPVPDIQEFATVNTERTIYEISQLAVSRSLHYNRPSGRLVRLTDAPPPAPDPPMEEETDPLDLPF